MMLSKKKKKSFFENLFSFILSNDIRTLSIQQDFIDQLDTTTNGNNDHVNIFFSKEKFYFFILD
jgi:hypothetical protein